MYISDFAKRTPLKKEDKDSIISEVMLSNIGERDSFISNYIDLMKNGTYEQKRKFVKEHPDLVERIFTLFKDRELGRMYVQTYGDGNERHHTSYFISEDLGEPIKRKSPVMILEPID